MLENKGVPREQMGRYGMLTSGGTASYGDVLRKLHARNGVKLEFWRSSPGGWRSGGAVERSRAQRGGGAAAGWLRVVTAASCGLRGHPGM